MKICPNDYSDHCDYTVICRFCGATLMDSTTLHSSGEVDAKDIQPGMLCFKVKTGKTPGQIIPLSKDEMIIGRSDDVTGEVDIYENIKTHYR